MNTLFGRIAEKSADAAGSPVAFIAAALFIVLWVAAGSVFHYSEMWQMLISVVTTIVTFLLVFLIQNSQNRETRAMQIKLNELIRATAGAHNAALNLEKFSYEELSKICLKYEALAEEARRRLHAGKSDVDAPEVSL